MMRSAVYFRVINWASLFALLLGLTAAGAFLLFSTKIEAPFDVEGYIILSLRNFSTYGGLYDRVHSEYGPAFFLIDEGIRSALGLEWTSESVRVLTLLNWIGTAICCGLIVFNRTQSKLLGALALTLTFTYLICNVYEPGHPGSMLALLVSVVALIGSTWDIAERPAAAAAVGALGTVVALSKVNVGALLLIAAGFWILMHTINGGSRYGRFVLYFILVVLPWVLMGSLVALPLVLGGRPLVDQSASVIQFALMFDIAIIGVFTAIESTPRNTVGANALIGLIIGAIVIASASLILIVARGTSFSGLISGVLLGPSKFPSGIFIAVNWGPISLITALEAFALAIGYYLRPSSRVLRHGVIFGRFLALGVLMATSMTPFSMAPVGLIYGLGVVALCTFPLSWDDSAIRDARFRQWIAILLVLQSLQAYPVAGSQISWGTYLLVPLLVISIKEAWDNLSIDLTALMRPPTMRSLGVCLIAMIAAWTLFGGVQKFNDGEWLELPGAEHLSLPIKTVLTFRTLSENVRAHADQLFSDTGAFSFNLWTGVPTPTSNFGAKREIITRLKDDYQAVIIRTARVPYKSQLGTYIEREFEPAFGVNGYEFLVHRGRSIAALSTASIRPDPGDRNYSLLSLTLGELNTPIASIEIWQTELRGRRLVARFGEGTGSLQVTPLNEDGTPSGETLLSPWPVQIHNSVTRLEGRIDAGLPSTSDLFVVVRSVDRTIASAPVIGPH